MKSSKAERKLRDVVRMLVNGRDTFIDLQVDGTGTLCRGGAAGETRISAGVVRTLLACGVLVQDRANRLRASLEARKVLARMEAEALPFRAQHGGLDRDDADTAPGSPQRLINRDESPIATLARPRGGEPPYLDGAAVAAAERLRADFERGQLQPRVTANWTAAVTSGRRSGESGGIADLTDAALAARIRVERACDAVGPEFAGLLLDVCCFLKGLELVERERRWPARSAKLVLRLGLEALSRHYGIVGLAEGPSHSGRVRHWGTEDFRPRSG
ncbi:DUF6456 domain-containing protein [Faunimonas sp. B44]|uniref:DUF6456 domain-containing protein n=1 Tax=Faunimonas sp. B44 TaxID=3461493 RepID=UPI004043DDAC